MSALFDRVSKSLAAGHAAAALDAWIDPRTEGMTKFRDAAVLIGITERDDPGFLLLHRPSHMRAHPGQVAFPGGKCDPGETPVQAALREADEELGIRPGDVRVIGTTDVYRTGSGYQITPVLGIVPPDTKITPNPAEVAQWFEAPVDFVLDPANRATRHVEWEGRHYESLEIVWNGHQIWGVTAAIIHNLAQRLSWNG